jgi:tRNA threonylcarbamoyladenosine biosynthesis protein TsaE
MMGDAVNTIEWTSKSLEQTLALGALIAQQVRAGDVIALNGHLGAGKTQFVRGLAAGLGVDQRLVSSPTFVLMSEYGTGNVDLPAVVHIDAYRLKGLSDLESMGWSPELLAGSATVIEWADRIAEELPDDHLRVELQHAPGDERQVTITAAGESWTERLPLMRAALERLGKAHVCPTCGAEVLETAESFPFCSKRCRLVDLNKWFRGDYRIGTELNNVEDVNDLEELQ